MDRIFNNNQTGYFDQTLYSDDPEYYQALVRSLISDSVDYEESNLRPDREKADQYYRGLEPRLNPISEEDVYDSSDETPEDEKSDSKSTAVSTDVKDTVMAVIPSLMRMFAGSEHALNFEPTSEESVEMAAQATDYIRHIFWEENEGFTILHDILKDSLVKKIGITTWYTTNVKKVQEKTFTNVDEEQLMSVLNENPKFEAEIVDQTPPDVNGMIASVTIRYVESTPKHVVESVAPDEFRISRHARNIETADLVGVDRIVRLSDLVELGYDPDILREFAGEQEDFSYERQERNPGGQMGWVTNDLVRFGRYFIRIDGDGDGINEVRCIHTIGSNFQIIEDYMVDDNNFALFSPDPEPHTAIGNSLADLVMDIQRINTNLLRGGLDSLSQSIYPRTVINQLLTNVEDALSDDVGAVIRTTGNTTDAVTQLVTPWVGKEVFAMKAQMDAMRQSRTGISEASKGVDPKALQSTNVMGIDLIATGAQERIELIARILAETGFKRMYKGLLREVTNNPNPEKTVCIRGKFTKINPSLFDPSMRCKVNPALGKGSDQTRMMALSTVVQKQELIMAKFGINNPVVGVQEYMNSVTDLLELVNIRNVSRYFKPITPEVLEQIQSAPKEPDPTTVLAQAELEKVKAGVIETQANIVQKDNKQKMDDDFRRDKLNVDSMVQLTGIFTDAILAQETMDNSVEGYNEPI